jgi:Tol biopolymer transport system component
MLRLRCVLLVGCSTALFLASACSASTTGQAAASRTPTVGQTGANELIAYSQFTDASLNAAVVKVGHLDGSGLRQLTGDGANVIDENPSWSPDGRRIAFDREQPQSGCGPGCVTREIYLVTVADRELTQLTHSPAGTACGGTAQVSCHFDPAWSPDGTQIAYAGSEGVNAGDRDGIWITNLAGQTRQVTTPRDGVADSGPAWSPDGASLAFSRRSEAGSAIFTVTAAGERLHQLTPLNGGFSEQPAWSPDGARIVFRSGPDVSSSGFEPSQLFSVPVAGIALTALTRAAPDLDYRSPTWSPDGSRIIAVRVQAHNDNGRARLVVMAAAGGIGSVVLTDANPQGSPRWGPAA